MNEDLLSVEQVAAMMDMHSRTIRRYIKEKKLIAAKFGGQWRIRKEDLKSLLSDKEFLAESKNIWNSKVENFLSGMGEKGDKQLQLCTIADCYLERDKIKQLSKSLLDLMNSEDEERSYAKFQYMYDNVKQKARFIIWANPKFLKKMIVEIAKYDEVEL